MIPWEILLKKMIWNQLSFLKNQKILDFGSGYGSTSNYLAKNNEVIAIEPNEEMLKERIADNEYTQLIGSLDCLTKLESESFDVILCHNVLEYITDHEKYFLEMERLLKPGGLLSLIKHNRNGRVIQMAVLLNDFEHANELLDKKNGNSEQFGAIQYYEDDEIMKYTTSLHLNKVYGIRNFWHLQQNQEIQRDKEWQSKMLELENRVSEIEDFRNMAFFHHLLLEKQIHRKGI